MHDYSIDRHPKEKIIFGLAFTAIVAAPAISRLVNSWVTELNENEWLSWAPVVAIPVFLLFLAIYSLFDHYLWRIGALRRVLLVPDLNGTWDCRGQTKLKNGQPETFDWTGRVVITQSWSKMSIQMQTGQSSSRSISASISRQVGVGYRLLYQYDNNPDAGEAELNRHTGTAEILINKTCSDAEGHYFTDQHRNTVGTLRLKKQVA